MFQNSESIVAIQYAEKNREWDSLSIDTFDKIRLRHDLFAQTAAVRTEIVTVTHVPSPDQVFGLSVSGDYFRMLGAHAQQGRLLTNRDQEPGAPPVAFLSDHAWRQLLGADPRALGKTIEIDGALYRVMGILPRRFAAPGSDAGAQLWTVLRPRTKDPAERGLRVYARLQRCTSLAQAQAFLDSLARCLNVAALIIARGVRKQREYAIRLAVGAKQGALIREALLEAAWIVLPAVGVSWSAAAIALTLIRNHLGALSAEMPNLVRVGMNGRCLLVALGAGALAAVICGLLPAFAATRIEPADALREAAISVTGSRLARRVLRLIVMFEATVSLLLLLNSGLLLRSLETLMSQDHGMRPDHVLTLRLPVGSWGAHMLHPANASKRIREYLNLLEQAQRVDGVQVAALASSLPLSHTVVRTRLRNRQVASIPGEPTIMPIAQAVTSGYFRAIGIPILAGRSFQTTDGASKLRMAIVNEAFAQKYLGGGAAIGSSLYNPESGEQIEVVGIARNSPHLDFAETVEPEIYFDFEQQLMTPFLTGLVVRSADDPRDLARRLRAALALRDAEQPVVHVETLQQLVQQNTWRAHFSAWFFSIFAAVALLLSAVGTYGVVAYVTAAATREYGVRAALGETPAGLFRLATWTNLKPVLTGIAIGAAGAFWTGKWISSLLYGIASYDPLTLALAVLVLIAAALIATAGPALRAARIDPVRTLRHE